MKDNKLSKKLKALNINWCIVRNTNLNASKRNKKEKYAFFIIQSPSLAIKQYKRGQITKR